jgi:translation initiation factor 3 subunit F
LTPPSPPPFFSIVVPILTLPVDLLTTNPTPSPALPPLPTLSASLDSLQGLIDDALAYVAKVNAGTEKGDPEVGRYLLEGVGRWSQSEGSADGEGVKEGLQDTLTVSFLSNLVRSQVELAGRLQLLPQAQQQQQQQQQQ